MLIFISYPLSVIRYPLSVIRYPLSVRNRHKINWTFIVQNFQKGEPACSPSPFIRYNQFLLET
ncbi:MAG: hypothetical protein VSS75_001270, partial [Candidatus Parabeggiatoa sp.]|nr:hypothetical protein [Candidatus Parabeggiatoa sp.]